MAEKNDEPKFVLCITNDDCEDLELHKFYRVLPDARAAKDQRHVFPAPCPDDG